MRRIHSTVWVAGLLGVGCMLVLSSPGKAQIARSVDLYTGGSPAADGIVLSGWGSGVAAEDRNYRSLGEGSIRIETNGYYAGARLQFQQPKDLTPQKQDPYGVLEFIIRFQPGRQRQTALGGFPGGSGGPGGFPGGSGDGGQGLSDVPGGFPGGSGGFPGGSGGPGGFPGGSGGPGGYPGAPGGYGGGYGGAEQIAPDTKRMKVVLVAEEGMFVASNFPVALYSARQEGWYAVAVPWVAFRGLEKANTLRIKEVRIFGDNKDTFWIGEIRTTSDDEPILMDSLDEQEVSVGDAVEFVASATGGISPLQYSWDFNKDDGIQEDAVGPRVIHVFRKPSPSKPGNAYDLRPYIVTCTVRDLGGAKAPVSREASVIVNP